MTRKDKIHFPCVEEGYKEKHKERMERVINISETSKREANNRNNESELRNPSPFLLRSYSDRFISHIKAKESQRIHL